MKRIIVLLVSILLCLPHASYASSRHDASSLWFEPILNAMIQSNYLPYMLQSDYKTNISRADICRLIDYNIRRNESFAATPLDYEPIFLDLPKDHIAYEEIMHLYHLGIVSGMDNELFQPDAFLSREQAASIFNLAASYLDDNWSALPFPEPFDDDHLISEWARFSVYQLAAKDVIQGSGHQFMPQATITREESYAIAYHLFRGIEEQSLDQPISGIAYVNFYQGEPNESYYIRSNNSPRRIDLREMLLPVLASSTNHNVNPAPDIKNPDPSFSMASFIYQLLYEEFQENKDRSLFYTVLNTDVTDAVIKQDHILSFHYEIRRGGTDVDQICHYSLNYNKDTREIISNDILLMLLGIDPIDLREAVETFVRQNIQEAMGPSADPTLLNQQVNESMDLYVKSMENWDTVFFFDPETYDLMVAIDWNQPAYGSGQMTSIAKVIYSQDGVLLVSVKTDQRGPKESFYD